jgi:hypothetical protein
MLCDFKLSFHVNSHIDKLFRDVNLYVDKLFEK